jgi:hypothetical protein
VVARPVSINAFVRQPYTVPNLEYGRYTRVYTRDYRSRVASLLVHVPGASGPGHQIAFPGGRPTCSASTQSPARRDDSRQSGAAQAFQYNTEKAATSGNGNKNYTVSPTTQGNRVTATFGVRQKFQPQSEIIADQLAPLSSSDTREPRPLCTSKEGNAVQVNEGSLQCTRLSAGQSSAVSNMGLSLTRAPASCPLVHSPASSTPAPTTQHFSGISIPKNVGICRDLVFTKYSQIPSNTLS